MKQILNIGNSPNDGTGDGARTGGGRIKANFDEIYAWGGDGSTLTALATVAFSGAYSALTGLPDIPAALTDLDTTVTGAQLDALKAKVDGIEENARADQTGAEIVAAIDTELSSTDWREGGGGGSGDMAVATYDPAGIEEQLVGLTATQTLTNKTITQPTLALKQGTGSTSEGVVEWDATANTLKVGTGSASHTFVATAHFSGDATVSTAGVVTFSGNSVDIAHLSATGTPSSTTYLRGDNTWATIAAAGDVTKVGTPVANRMAYWTGDGTLGHEDGFTYDPTTDTLTVAKIVVGGTTLDGTTLADPGGDRLMGWDDGLGTTSYFEIGDGLDLTSGVLSATALADPDADALMGWDDTAGAAAYFEIGTGLDLTAGVLSVTGGATGDMLAATYDPAGIAQQVVGTTATQTLTNKTLAQPTLQLKQSTTAAPTTEGVIEWDSDSNRIAVGNNVAPAYFIPAAAFSGDATLSDDGVVTIAAGFYKSGGTDVAVADGGTGASTALGAVNNLSVGMASVSLTDGATITPDFSAGRNFHVTLGGNRTLANPTNQVAGQGGRILVTQDGTGSRTLAYGSNWKFFGSATLTTTAGAIDMIVYDVQASGTIYASLIKNAVAP